MNATQTHVLQLLANYRPDDLEQAENRQLFKEFIRQHADCAERRLATGHLTGSAWLVSKDCQRALLMHHRKLERWLQPGGHADGSGDLAQVILREAEEETGLSDLAVEPRVFDLDRHRIPARGAEPEHFHYDVRFVVRAEGGEAFMQNEESLALAWFDIKKLADDGELDASIRRMARKWLAR